MIFKRTKWNDKKINKFKLKDLFNEKYNDLNLKNEEYDFDKYKTVYYFNESNFALDA